MCRIEAKHSIPGRAADPFLAFFKYAAKNDTAICVWWGAVYSTWTSIAQCPYTKNPKVVPCLHARTSMFEWPSYGCESKLQMMGPRIMKI